MTSEIEVDAGIGGEATDPAALRQYHNTIRKLVTQVQEEKRLRRELEEKQATVDEQRHLQSELDQAWARSGEDAARAARVEVQLTEVRQELEDLRKLHSSICERLLHTESESAQRLEEIFARDIKIADLEGALRDAQGRAASAEDEAKRFSTKLATASQQVSTLQSEVSELRINLGREAERAGRVEAAASLAEDRGRRCEQLEHELLEVRAGARSAAEEQAQMRAAARAAEDRHVEASADARRREERLVAAVRGAEALRNVEALHGVEASADGLTELQSENKGLKVEIQDLAKEVPELRQKLQSTENEARLAEERTAIVQTELAVYRTELQGLHVEEAGVKRGLAACGAELAATLAERDIAREQVTRLQEAHTCAEEAREELFEQVEEYQAAARITTCSTGLPSFERGACTQCSQLRRQLEDCRKLLLERMAPTDPQPSFSASKALSGLSDAAPRGVSPEPHPSADYSDMHGGRAGAVHRDLRAELLPQRQQAVGGLTDPVHRGVSPEPGSTMDFCGVKGGHPGAVQRDLRTELFQQRQQAQEEHTRLQWQLKELSARMDLMSKDHRHSVVEQAKTQRRANELKGKLETTEAELRVEQERAQEARNDSFEMREALRRQDDTAWNKMLQLKEALVRTEDEVEGLEDGTERLHRTYQKRLAKAQRRLVERETYESKLKHLLDKEVDVLHRCNQGFGSDLYRALGVSKRASTADLHGAGITSGGAGKSYTEVIGASSFGMRGGPRSNSIDALQRPARGWALRHGAVASK